MSVYLNSMPERPREGLKAQFRELDGGADLVDLPADAASNNDRTSHGSSPKKGNTGNLKKGAKGDKQSGKQKSKAAAAARPAAAAAAAAAAPAAAVATPASVAEGEDEVVEGYCQFCGMEDPAFTEEKLDLHYWQDCRMLTSCKQCEQVPGPRLLLDSHPIGFSGG
jgi:hypothetical protein